MFTSRTVVWQLIRNDLNLIPLCCSISPQSSLLWNHLKPIILGHLALYLIVHFQFYILVQGQCSWDFCRSLGNQLILDLIFSLSFREKLTTSKLPPIDSAAFIIHPISSLLSSQDPSSCSVLCSFLFNLTDITKTHACLFVAKKQLISGTALSNKNTMWAIRVILSCLVNIKINKKKQVNLIFIFPLTRYIQNVILMCNRYKSY